MTFTIHRRKTPNTSNLRCIVRGAEGHIIVSRRRNETQWRVWVDRVGGICLFAPTLKAALVLWKLNQ